MDDKQDAVMEPAKGDVLTVHAPTFEVLTPDGWTSGMVEIIENAGRRCYKSEHRIEPGSAEKFVSRFCRDTGHSSMLEHAFATVVWTGSRAMSHQLVRHRLAAYSQESQRYCDYGKKGFHVVPVDELPLTPGRWEITAMTCGRLAGPIRWQHEDGETLFAHDSSPVQELLKFQWLSDCRDAYIKYLWWRDKAGFRAESARFKLPNETKTEVAATYDFNMWRHIFEHRGLNPHAQWEIRGIAQKVLVAFAEKWPSVFADLAKRIPACNVVVQGAEEAYAAKRKEKHALLTYADFRL